VFTARYGLIPYMKHITYRLLKVKRLISNDFFLPPENRAVYNVGKYGTAIQAADDNIIRRMRVACWITKAIDTYSGQVILIAFAAQQWICERASVLRHTYPAYLVKHSFK
jgi:hypothetical protein